MQGFLRREWKGNWKNPQKWRRTKLWEGYRPHPWWLCPRMRRRTCWRRRLRTSQSRPSIREHRSPRSCARISWWSRLTKPTWMTSRNPRRGVAAARRRTFFGEKRRWIGIYGPSRKNLGLNRRTSSYWPKISSRMDKPSPMFLGFSCVLLWCLWFVFYFMELLLLLAKSYPIGQFKSLNI